MLLHVIVDTEFDLCFCVSICLYPAASGKLFSSSPVIEVLALSVYSIITIIIANIMHL